MTLHEFREAVLTEFGPNMVHATPENVRRFTSRMYTELTGGFPTGLPVLIPTDSADDYAQVVASFFARAPFLPPEQATILLWLFAAEMYYSELGELNHEILTDLFTIELSE